MSSVSRCCKCSRHALARQTSNVCFLFQDSFHRSSSGQGCVYQQEILSWDHGGQVFYHIIIWQLPCWAWPTWVHLSSQIPRFHASLRPACWLQLVGSRYLRSVACPGRWARPALVDWTSNRPTAVFRGEGLVGQGDPWWIREWDVLILGEKVGVLAFGSFKHVFLKQFCWSLVGNECEKSIQSSNHKQACQLLILMEVCFAWSCDVLRSCHNGVYFGQRGDHKGHSFSKSNWHVEHKYCHIWYTPADF